MGGNLGGWGDPPPLRPGRNIIPYGQHESGRDKKPPGPPNKGCGGKKRTFCFFFVVMSAAAGTVAQAINLAQIF